MGHGRRALGVAAAIAASLIAPATAPAQTDREELERNRPILRYATGEEHHAQPVTRTAEPLRPDAVYGRVAEEEDERWLQYWLFYPYNDQDRGVFRTGRHEGDWEFVQFRVRPGGKIDAATFAQHSWAEACGSDELETADEGDGSAPVVYVAHGSHASYPRAGTTDRPWPDPNDEADGEGRVVQPRLIEISETDPAWVSDPELWGSSRAGIVPGEQSSPVGPLFTDDERWRHPASYHRIGARECGSGAPPRLWATGLAVLFGLIVLVAAVFAIRRRANSRDLRKRSSSTP